MLTIRNFSKISKNILNLSLTRQIKFNKKIITQQTKDCMIKNYKSHPEFTVKFILKKYQSQEYVDDLVMRSSMMI